MGCGSSNLAVQNNHTSSTSTISVQPQQKLVTYSESELKELRKEFWESRVDGSPEMYIALRSVCEAILNKDSGLADAILQASNITTTGSTLSQCYDERGHEYNIPSYCWSSEGPPDLTKKTLTTESKQRFNKDTIANADKDLVLKVQISPGDRNFTVSANTSNSVAELKRLICEASTTKSERNTCTEPVLETRQRIIFMGKELRNAQYLGDIGLDGERVIQVFLRKI